MKKIYKDVTKEEKEILKMAAKGFADEDFKTPFDIENIKSKFGAKTLLQAAIIAIKEEII